MRSFIFGLILVSVVTCSAVHAEGEYWLAYYVEIEQDDGKLVLQQHGQSLSLQKSVSTPIGRGGRGLFSLSLASLDASEGVLRLEVYDDSAKSSHVRVPVYSLDVPFSVEGAKGDVADASDGVNVELSYSLAPK